MRGRATERFVGRAVAYEAGGRLSAARGARKSIFARLDRRRFVRHVGGERRAAGNRAIWCAPRLRGPGITHRASKACPAARGEENLLNPPERRAHLETCPGQGPSRAPGPLNIDTGGTKTPRRPSPSLHRPSLPARAFRRRPRG